MTQREELQERVRKVQQSVGSRAIEEAQADARQRATAAQQVAALREKYGLRQPSLAERLEGRGVPDAIARMVLAGDTRETDASRLAFQLVQGDGMLLVLRSPPGRGKSVAACWALSQVAGLFVGSTALAVIDESGSLDARMKTTGLLVVDDLGVEHSPSGFAVARLDDVVTQRMHYGKPTLLTTNLEQPQFAERYGARLTSRIDGDPLGWRELGGPDLRGGA